MNCGCKNNNYCNCNVCKPKKQVCGCKILLSDKCVIHESGELPAIGITNGSTLENALVNINNILEGILEDTSEANIVQIIENYLNQNLCTLVNNCSQSSCVNNPSLSGIDYDCNTGVVTFQTEHTSYVTYNTILGETLVNSGDVISLQPLQIYTFTAYSNQGCVATSVNYTNNCLQSNCTNIISGECVEVTLPDNSILTLNELAEQLIDCCQGNYNLNILNASDLCNINGEITISGYYDTDVGSADTINIISGGNLVGSTSFTNNTYSFNIQGSSQPQTIVFTISNNTLTSPEYTVSVSPCTIINPSGTIDTINYNCDPNTGLITIGGTYTSNTGLAGNVIVSTGQMVLNPITNLNAYEFQIQDIGVNQLVTVSIEISPGIFTTNSLDINVNSCTANCIVNQSVSYNCNTNIISITGDNVLDVVVNGISVTDGDYIILTYGSHDAEFTPIDSNCPRETVTFFANCVELEIINYSTSCDFVTGLITITGNYTNNTPFIPGVFVTSGQTPLNINTTLNTFSFDIDANNLPNQSLTFNLSLPPVDSNFITTNLGPCYTCLGNPTISYNCIDNTISLGGDNVTTVVIDGDTYEDGDVVIISNGTYTASFNQPLPNCGNPIDVLFTVNCIPPTPGLDIIQCNSECNGGIVTVQCQFNNTTGEIPELFSDNGIIIIPTTINEFDLEFQLAVSNTPQILEIHLETSSGAVVSNTEIINLPPCS